MVLERFLKHKTVFWSFYNLKWWKVVGMLRKCGGGSFVWMVSLMYCSWFESWVVLRCLEIFLECLKSWLSCLISWLSCLISWLSCWINWLGGWISLLWCWKSLLKKRKAHQMMNFMWCKLSGTGSNPPWYLGLQRRILRNPIQPPRMIPKRLIAMSIYVEQVGW